MFRWGQPDADDEAEEVDDEEAEREEDLEEDNESGFASNARLLDSRARSIDLLNRIPIVGRAANISTLAKHFNKKTKPGGGGGSDQTTPQPSIPSVPLHDCYMHVYQQQARRITEAYAVGQVEEVHDIDDEDRARRQPFASLTRGGGTPSRKRKRDSHEESSEDSGGGGLAQRMPTDRGQEMARLQQRLEQDWPLSRIVPGANVGDDCFLCQWGNRFHDGIKAKHMIKLYEIWGDYGACDDGQLAKMMSDYFAENIYNRANGMPMLYQWDALLHIQNHTLAAEVYVGTTIRDCRQNAFLLKNQIWKADGSYDSKALADWKSTILLERTMRLTPMGKMNFNMGKTDEDLKKLGKPFHIAVICKQREDKEKSTLKKQRLLEKKDAGFEF